VVNEIEEEKREGISSGLLWLFGNSYERNFSTGSMLGSFDPADFAGLA
jgi:hypothetical protein